MLDLRFFGFALWLRWEWLARTSRQVSQASLPHKPEKEVAATASVSMRVTIGEGASARLWIDSWSSIGPLCHFAPNLFAALSRAGKKRSVRDGLLQNHWARDIVGHKVLCQYLRVWNVLCASPWIRCRRTVSFGDGTPMVHTRLPRPTKLSLQGRQRSLGQRSCGRRKLHRTSNFSFGSLYTGGFGRLIDASDTVCRTTMRASSAARRLKPVSTSSPGMFWPGNFGLLF